MQGTMLWRRKLRRIYMQGLSDEQNQPKREKQKGT